MAWNNPYSSGASRGQRQTGGFSYFPPGIKFLLVSNVAIFLLQLVVGPFHSAGGASINDYIDHYGPLFPLGTNFRIWQPITYMFLHEGFMHILFNMLALYWFGVQVEQAWGTRRFLIYYAICGLGGAAAHVMLSATLTGATGPLVGASGAIFGVLVAFGLLFPDQTLMIFPIPIPIRAKFLVIGYIALEIFSLSNGDNISHLAHLGGAAAGILYWVITNGRHALQNRQRQQAFRGDAWANRGGTPDNSRSSGIFGRPKREDRSMVDAEYHDVDQQTNAHPEVKQARVITQEEIDRILDKIAATGYQNLTEGERDVLFEASKRMEERS